MYADYTVKVLLEKTASSSPVPGGGSMAALGAAIAAGLSEMVANLTIGKNGFNHVQEQMKKIAEQAVLLREKLLKDIDRDSDAFKKVMEAFSLPRETNEEKTIRSNIIQSKLKNAALIPLEVAEDALNILGLAGTAVKEGNKNAITDGVVSAMMARTAALSALYNVKINLKSIKDEDFVRKLDQQIETIAQEVIIKEKQILKHIDL